MENTEFKMLLCCTNIGMNLLLSCAAQDNVAVCAEEKRPGDTQTISSSSCHTLGSLVWMCARKLEWQSFSFLCNCEPGWVCSLPRLLAEGDFLRDQDRVATVQLFCSCLCSRTSRDYSTGKQWALDKRSKAHVLQLVVEVHWGLVILYVASSTV